jgi:NAD(P)-dependent dehydrogenase (short-subunit alcohol dehydrogenase family)
MNIIVNGGTRGIGKEVVIKLALDINNHILVTGRNSNALKALSAKHKNVSTLTFDISTISKHHESYVKCVANLFEKIDVVINMAGTLTSKVFTDISEKEARQMMETNFFGPAFVIRWLKHLMEYGSHVINISSMGGFQGSEKYKGLSYYSASKAAIASLSECLANEFSDDGISVNCLALGAVQTEMLEEAFPGYKAPVNAGEMAEFISYFALNGHKFFNGKILPVAVYNP